MKLRFSKLEDLIYLAPLVCFGAAGMFSQWGPFEAFEWRTLDWRTQARAEWGQPAPDPRIVVLGIGAISTRAIEPWPFRRSYHAILQQLARNDPPAVWVWDVIFSERYLRSGQSELTGDDADFADSTDYLSEAGTRVVFAAETAPDPTGDNMKEAGRTQPLIHMEGERYRLQGDTYGGLPYAGLRASGYFGFADAERGAGGVVRAIPMVVRVGNAVYPSLSLQAAMQLWGLEADDVRVVLGDAVYLGAKAQQRRIPIDEAGLYLVNYRYEKMEPGQPLGIEIPTIEYYNQLIDLQQKYRDEDPTGHAPVPLRNRIVLVGEFSTDTGPSPRVRQSPLVLLHANVLNNILRDDYVVRLPTVVTWGGFGAIGLLGLLMRRRSIWLLSAFTVAVLAGYVLAAYGTWFVYSLWLPLAGPVLGFGLLQFVVITHRVILEQRAKAEIRSMFGSYLSPELMRQMMAEGRQADIGGDRREVTILFSDLRNFTAWSERTPEAELIKQLNEYLGAMVECIHAEGGTLHKFIGDAVMAVWGDLHSRGSEEDATRACRAALGMQARLRELNEGWAQDGRHQHRMGIGLNHGAVVVGNVGSPQRMEFTVIGDPVNLAARLESLTKEQGVEILVGETVRRLVESRFELRAKGEVTVKGKSIATSIFELVDETAPLGSGPTA